MAVATTPQSPNTSDVFAGYGSYYDLLYADKNYAQEASYVAERLREQYPNVTKVVEFGSGTGRHGRHLARDGFEVVGIERSPVMLAQSELAATSEPKVSSGSFRSFQGDVRSFRAPGEFEAAISLFHVVSYQTTNDDILSMFRNVSHHLIHEGLFLFDVWYAPAVLTLRPETRAKRVANDELRVTRIAEPMVHTEQNCVDVNYEIFVEECATGMTRRVQEQHRMRYFTNPEMGWIADLTGFEVLGAEEWLTRKAPSTDTWGVCYLLRKKV